MTLPQAFASRIIVALLSVVLFAAADWRQFRGSQGTGVAEDQKLPIDWETHQAWKAELPGRGPSGPIVVGNRVFVSCSSGAEQDRLHVLCFDAQTGKQLWERQAWATGRCYSHPASANAAPTPASDGRRVFAFYSSSDLLCFDLDGNLQWLRGLAVDFPKAGSDVGMASSPLTVGDTVVVQVEAQGDSFAAGFDVATGETRWHIERDRAANWASPVAMKGHDGKDVVLLQSAAGLTAHDAHTGAQLWQYKAGCSVIPSLTVVNDTIYLPSNGITALRPAGTSTPEVVWQENKLGAGTASPVVHQGKLYVVNNSGVLVAGDATKGEVLWRLRLQGNFWATPVASGKHMFLVSGDEGIAQVVELEGEGKVVGSMKLGEKIQGTPAVSQGAIYVRSDKHLWKFAE